MDIWRAFATLQEVAGAERGDDPLRVLDEVGRDFETLRVVGAITRAADGTHVRTDCSFADAARRLTTLADLDADDRDAVAAAIDRGDAPPHVLDDRAHGRGQRRERAGERNP